MQKIVPFLWFNKNAEEAMNFYSSVFKNSSVVNVTRNGKGGPGPEGSVLMGVFEIGGQSFYALNGGPQYTFNPAISFLVNCETQEEIDDLWEKLSEGGEKIECGWLRDQYGVSWQIVPAILNTYMSDPDPEKKQRVLQAVWSMKKLEIKEMEKAFKGE